MKKKLLFAVVPALLILSACNAAPKEGAKNVLLQEDTLAHEELFGQPEFKMVDTRVRNAAPVTDTAFPAIGVQKSATRTIKVSGVDTSVFSVRFVAAVTLDLDHLEDVHPVWTRVLYEDDGDGTLKASNTFESTKAYEKINDGGSEILPSSFGAGYNRFVAYTMTNIPAEYSNCYFNVSLSLEGVPSRVLATKADLSAHYSFNAASHDYFLSGTVEGEQKDLQADYPTRSNGNQATFTADFEINDSFYIFHKTSSEFKVWNSDCFGDVGDYFEPGSNKLIKSLKQEHVRLYLNNSGELYKNAFTVSNTNWYVRQSNVDDWLNSASAETKALYQLKTDGGDSVAVIYNVHLVAGKFQIASLDWVDQWGSGDGSGGFRVQGATSNFSGDWGNPKGDITCTVAGDYNIMIKNDAQNHLYIWEA